jgi:hypothetical protein
MIIDCKLCGKSFTRKKKNNVCCGRSCGAKLSSITRLKNNGYISPITHGCLNCGVPTQNPKFCSKSCSSIVTNKLHKKRKPVNKEKCVDCLAEYFVKDNRRVRCQTCFENWRKRSDNLTLNELEKRNLESGIHPSWLRSELRSHCRRMNRHREMACQICGYSNHVEMCHIKPVSKFDKNVPFSIINSPENILILCPNHHWEFDSGIISIESIPR